MAKIICLTSRMRKISPECRDAFKYVDRAQFHSGDNRPGRRGTVRRNNRYAGVIIMKRSAEESCLGVSIPFHRENSYVAGSSGEDDERMPLRTCALPGLQISPTADEGAVCQIGATALP